MPTFARHCAHPPRVVFAAYADIDQRTAWSAPSDDEIVTPRVVGETMLNITDQVTSVAWDGPIEGSRHGYTAMLDQLDKHLSTVA